MLLFSAFGQDKRLALVIGNGNYEKGILKNPVNDALLMKETLEKLNFEVILDTNLRTRTDLLNSINLFGEKRKNYSVGFVYYAGHGVNIDGNNYILATKEKYDSKINVKDNGVNVTRFLEYFELAKNEINILVLDACRNNPFEKNWTTSSRSLEDGLGLAPLSSSGNIIAFSTSAGATASDGNEKAKNSSYCLSLVKNMTTPDLDLDQIFRNVRKEVREISGGNQLPTVDNHYEGSDFYFAKSTYADEILQIDSLIDTEDYSQALIKVSEVLGKSPNNKLGLLRIGRIEYSQDLNYNGSHLILADSLYPNDSEVLEYLSRYYATIRDYVLAFNSINRAIVVDPSKPQLYYWKARFFEENNELEKAEIEYTRSLILDSSMTSFVYRADFFLKNEKYLQALQDYTKIIDFDINNPSHYELRANCYIQMEDYLNALKDYSKAIQLAPDSAYFYNNRADFYGEYLQKNELALLDYEKAIEIAKGSYQKCRALNNRALIYETLEKYDLALKEYTKSIEIDPTNPLPYSNRANVQLKLLNDSFALIDFNKAIELDINNPICYENRANCYIQMEDYLNALNDYNMAIQLAPDSAYFYNNRADFYSDYLQKNDLALLDYEKAIEIAKDSYQKFRALNNRALIYSEQNAIEMAINEYSKAFQIESNEPILYANRADCYLRLGEFDKSILDFTKAIQLESKNPIRYENRANCYIQMLDYRNALKDLNIAIDLAPDKAYFYNNRADFYREFFKKDELALRDYTKALEIAKDTYQKMRSLHNSALIYEVQGKFDLAFEQYSKALEFGPNEPLPYSNRANFLFMQSKFELALIDFTKAIELSDDKAPQYRERAYYFLNRGEYDKALIDFSLAIENSTLDKSFYLLDRAAFYEGSLKKEMNAYDDYKKSFELDSTNRDALIGVCIYKKSQGEFKEAIEFLERWHNSNVLNDSIRANYLIIKGGIKSSKGDYEEALKDFNNSIPLDFKSAYLYFERAKFYEYYLNDLENALKDYSKSIELEPENAEYYLRRSDVFFKLGNYKNQTKDIIKMRKIDPKSIDFAGKEALGYAVQGDCTKALQLSDNAIKMAPDNYMAYLYKAKILIQNKDYLGSQNLLKKIMEMEPNDPEAFFLMGKIYELKGENFNAVYMYSLMENKYTKGTYWITDDLGNELEKSEVYYQIAKFYEKIKVQDLTCKMYCISLDLINKNQLFRLKEIKKEIQEKLKSCQN